MLILLAQLDPIVSEFAEKYGLPGVVIAIMAAMMLVMLNGNRKMQDRLDAYDKQQEKDKQYLKDIVATQEDKITRRDTRIDFLEKSLLNAQAALNHKTAEEQQIRGALDNLRETSRQEMKKAGETISSLEGRLNEILIINDRLATENTRLIEENQGYMNQIASLSEQLNLLQQQLSSLQQQIEQKDQEITALRARVDKIDTKEIKDPTP